MNSPKFAFLLLGLAVPLCPAPLKAATVVFSNFGPGASYETGTAESWQVFGPGTGPAFGFLAYAAPFTVDKPTMPEIMRAPISSSVRSDSVDFFIHPDEGGVPGALRLGQMRFRPPSGSTPRIISSSITNAALLQPGETYWLAATAPIFQNYRWHFTTEEFSPSAPYATSSGAWSQRSSSRIGAFEIQGTIIPEPGAVPLLLGGAMLLAGLRRRPR